MSASVNIRFYNSSNYSGIREFVIGDVSDSLDEAQALGDLIAHLQQRRESMLIDRYSYNSDNTSEYAMIIARELSFPEITALKGLHIGGSYVSYRTTLALLSQQGRREVLEALRTLQAERQEQAPAEPDSGEFHEVAAEPFPDPPGTAHAFGTRYAVDPRTVGEEQAIVEI